MLKPKPVENRATLEQVERHARHAVCVALDYFGQDNADFPVTLLAGANLNEAAAICAIDVHYLRANIRYDADFFQKKPERIWQIIGHEVAHIMSRELLGHKPEIVKEGNTEQVLFQRGIEAVTTRLERMFTRDCPDPGWDK